AAVASIGCALAPDLGSLAALRFITALFSSSPVTLGMAHVGDQVPVAERQSVIARFVTGTIIGQAFGPLLGGLLTDLIGWRGTFVVLGLAFIAVAAVLFVSTRAQWSSAASGGSPYTVHLRLLGVSRVRYVLAAAFADTFFFFGAYSFLGPFLKLKFDLGPTVIGAILAVVGLGSILYTLAVKRLLAAMGQRGLVTWGGAICCACYALALLAPQWAVAIPCAVGIGFSFYMLQNTLQLKATEMAPQARGAGMSLYASAWSAGQGCGVALAGAAISVAGYAPTIFSFGLGFLALGLLLRNNLSRLS
ncbi:MAG: MFS transporter, partial [Betaproteobacteria bacterium]|nr:MFS transporter [Betaproteobacteria bacterium]